MLPINLSASSINGTDVVNREGENLGNIKEVMIDTNNGKVSYVVLSFGGFLGMGDKYFAIPWEAFSIDSDDKEFVLEIPKEKLETAPGFDKDNWPTNADHDYLVDVYRHYGYAPYWEKVNI